MVIFMLYVDEDSALQKEAFASYQKYSKLQFDVEGLEMEAELHKCLSMRLDVLVSCACYQKSE